jgi:hypothetical protein
MVDGRYEEPPLRLRLAILAGVILVLVGLPVATVLWMTAVPGRSWSGPLPPLDAAEKALAARLRTDVEAIAAEPHNVAHKQALERSARYLEGRLAGLGYPVVAQRFQAGGVEVRNLEIVVEPARADSPTLVIGAHYDSAGGAPGANDNATRPRWRSIGPMSGSLP